MKTKDERKKQTENKAEAKLANALKIIEKPKKQTENKPENKAGHVIENTGSLKNKPKTKQKLLRSNSFSQYFMFEATQVDSPG